MLRLVFKKNKIPYGQDMQFWQGIPEGVEFFPEKFTIARIKLVGKGHGLVPHYGNGALYVSVTDLPQKAVRALKRKGLV